MNRTLINSNCGPKSHSNILSIDARDQRIDRGYWIGSLTVEPLTQQILSRCTKSPTKIPAWKVCKNSIVSLIKDLSRLDCQRPEVCFLQRSINITGQNLTLGRLTMLHIQFTWNSTANLTSYIKETSSRSQYTEAFMSYRVLEADSPLNDYQDRNSKSIITN